MPLVPVQSVGVVQDQFPTVGAQKVPPWQYVAHVHCVEDDGVDLAVCPTPSANSEIGQRRGGKDTAALAAIKQGKTTT